MRLICGYLHLDGRPAEADRLNTMVKAMVKNDLNPFIRHEIAGPLALATLDFAECSIDERMSTELPKGSSGLALAADVRLDVRTTGNDDQDLIALLEGDAVDGIHRALGDFAFAAWDPADNSLLCARDALGIRPFFYTHLPGNVFVFASLPCGLHASGFVERSLDEEFFVNEIIQNHGPAARSFFLGVERLVPGTWLRVNAQGIKKGSHWHLDPALGGSRILSPEDAAAQLAELVTESVRCRLPALGQVAAHLSGGIDSAAISILAARALRDQERSVLAYSLVPSSSAQTDKNPYIDAVLRQESNIAWYPLSIDNALGYLLPNMNQDQPLAQDPADPDVQAFVQASTRGARIFLSGWGGDEGASFNGRGVLAEAMASGHWRYLAKELRALALRSGCSLLQTAWGELQCLLPPSFLTLVSRLREGPAAVPAFAISRAFLSPEFTPRIYAQRPGLLPDGRSNRLKLLTAPGLTRRTEHWAITGAHFGLAAAFPLLDRRIVEFAFSLPSNLFVRDGWRRRVFRDAMGGILPEQVRLKPSKVDSTLDSPPVAEQYEKLQEKLIALKRHERVARVFDLDTAERELRNLYIAEKPLTATGKVNGDRTAAVTASALFRTFRYASYVQQHH